MPEMQAEEVRLRLKQRRGPDLISALADEIALLHDKIEQVQRELRGFESYRILREQLALTDDAGNAGRLMPDYVEIGAAENLEAQDGFHGIEYTPDGSAYRWTEPGRTFTFRVFIDR